MKTRLFIFLCLLGVLTVALGQEWKHNKDNEYRFITGIVANTSTFKIKSFHVDDKLLGKKDDPSVITKNSANTVYFEIVLYRVDIFRNHTLSAVIFFDDKKQPSEKILRTSTGEVHLNFPITVKDEGSHTIELKFFARKDNDPVISISHYSHRFAFAKTKPSQTDECKLMYEKVDKQNLASIKVFINTHCDQCETECKQAKIDKERIEAKQRASVIPIGGANSGSVVGGSNGTGKPLILSNSDCKTKWETQVNRNNKEEVRKFITENCANGGTCPACYNATKVLQGLENEAINPKITNEEAEKPNECISGWENVDKKDKRKIRAFRKKYCAKSHDCTECIEAEVKENSLVKGGRNDDDKTLLPPPPPCQIDYVRDVANLNRFYLTSHKEIALDQAQLEVRDEKGIIIVKHNIKIIPKGDAIYEVEGVKGKETIKIITRDCGSITLKLDNPPFNATPNLIVDTIKFNISGGTPPYRFMVKDNDDFLIGVGEIKDGKLNIKQWLADREEESGTYKIQCKDADNQQGVGGISYPYTPATSPMYFLLVSLGLLLLGGLGYGGYWFMKKKRKKDVDAKMDSNQHNKTPDVVQQEVTKVSPSIAISRKEGETTPVKKVVIPSKITITGKKSGATPLKQGEKLNYVRAEMSELWEDSAVSVVYISHKVIRDIYKFVGDETARSKEAGEEAAEVGGFLLGNISDYNTETASYEVSIDKFVATQAQDNNVYQMTFGLEAAKELDKIRDENTDMVTIGWFHTHPGHGLFLSQPDIRVHDSFFAEKYQIALEIDPLTPDLEAAIFTRKKNDEVNNQQDRKAGADWFKWVDWEKETRTK